MCSTTPDFSLATCDNPMCGHTKPAEPHLSSVVIRLSFLGTHWPICGVRLHDRAFGLRPSPAGICPKYCIKLDAK